MRVRFIVSAGIVISLLCGCTPEETIVTVKASALKKAVSGELAYANVKMMFDIKDLGGDPDLPARIRKIALPYLGTNAIIEVEKTVKRKVRDHGRIMDDEEEEIGQNLDDAKLIASFSIPVGTRETLMAAHRSILWLKYTSSNKTFCLVRGNAIRSMNKALSVIRDDDAFSYNRIEFEYDGGMSSSLFGNGTTIRITDDEAALIGVAAVEVNGKKVIAGSYDTQKGEISISYNNEFYHDQSPSFSWGGFPKMVTERLNDDSLSWEQDLPF